MSSADIMRPSMMTVPEVCCSTPAMIRSVVDLPQPEGPSKHVTCPGRIDNDTWLTTSRPSKERHRSVTSRRGCKMGVSKGTGVQFPIKSIGFSTCYQRPQRGASLAAACALRRGVRVGRAASARHHGAASRNTRPGINHVAGVEGEVYSRLGQSAFVDHRMALLFARKLALGEVGAHVYDP